MIGPFWCEESKCWVRFTANNTGFIAEAAAKDPVDKTLTMDWKPATENFWQIQYQEHNEQRIDEGFILLEGKLYRTAFKKNPITQEINVNTYNLNEQSIVCRLQKGNNPFENKSLQPITDISFDQLPLTPERRKERDIDRASIWTEWQNLNLREQLKLEGLSTFDPTASRALLSTLIKQLHELTPTQYSSPQLYQEALIKAIFDNKDSFYQKVSAFGNIVDETGMNPDDSGAAIDAVDINERRTAFAFAVLGEELKQLNTTFGLVTPTAPITDNTLNIPTAPTLTRPSTGSTNVGLITSIRPPPLGVDSDEPEPFVTPEPPITPGSKPFHSPLDNIPPSIPAPPITHIDAVINAVNKYKEWYKLGTPHRGANGWFSSWRHGETGQHRADILLEKIKKCITVEDAEEVINKFLTQPDTRYHRHSFSSFLLDELRNPAFQLQSWVTLKQDPQGFYDKQEIIDVLDNQGSPANN